MRYPRLPCTYNSIMAAGRRSIWGGIERSSGKGVGIKAGLSYHPRRELFDVGVMPQACTLAHCSPSQGRMDMTGAGS